MEQYSTTPMQIFNVWGKMPDDIVLGRPDPGVFSMIPHFFYEFNGNPNVSVIYAGLACGARGKHFLSLSPEKLSEYMREIFTEKTMFCFDNLFEGNITPMIDIIYKSLEISKIDASQCYYFSGALDSNYLHEDYCKKNDIKNPIKVYSCNTWEYSLKKESVIKDREYTAKKKSKTFLCFNRILRPHRLGLVALCHEKNLIDNSYYSFFNDSSHNGIVDMNFIKRSIQLHSSEKVFNRIFDSYDSLLARLPLKLNIDWTENANYVKADDLNFFDDSYFSLVTETYFFPFYHVTSYDTPGRILQDGQSIFFSEKVFKPIIMRHPFILASRPGSLEMLRKIGFKTFSPFIDESYDMIRNDGDRLSAIVDEVERLSKFNDDQWHEWQSNIKEIVDHNHQVLMNRKKHMYAFTRPDYENQY